MTAPWTILVGRELDTTPLDRLAKPTRVVACLNVWNDAAALKLTVPIWQRYVDHTIVVDGSYPTIGKTLSTDGTREFMQGQPKTTLVDAAGLTQCEKRSLFFAHTKPGDFLFVIDADEHVSDPQNLRSIPLCDVAWVQMLSSIYQRPYAQPRIIRWMPHLSYRGRHHWIYQRDALVCTHQYSGSGYAHRPMALTIRNQRHLGRSQARIQVKHTNLTTQAKTEHAMVSMPSAQASDTQLHAREALQIVHHAYRDDGLAPSRLHTAINRTTPHWSVFFKMRPGPFGVPTQYTVQGHSKLMEVMFAAADVVHFHSVMSMAARIAPPGKHIVYHHHGTLFRRNAAQYSRDARRLNALVLLSNLELFSWAQDGPPAHFLPNAMPVARYRALRALHYLGFAGDRPFRIGHSPSHPEKKGTLRFIDVCARLTARGIPVQPVIMQNKSHREVLLTKASCDAFFDSFWLGIQCSGLEAAAMQMPVIAGDTTVAGRYREKFGAIPYTFADTEEELEIVIEQLVSDAAFRRAEQERVALYTVTHHDEAAVALRYLNLLDDAFQWRSTLRTSNRAAIAKKVTPAKVRR